jgi:hypothetical protein
LKPRECSFSAGIVAGSETPSRLQIAETTTTFNLDGKIEADRELDHGEAQTQLLSAILSLQFLAPTIEVRG